MSRKKRLLIGITMSIITTIGVVYYQYNRPVKDVADLAAEPVKATDLFHEFLINEPQANKSYLNKALEVSGKVMEINQGSGTPSQIILDAGDAMFGVACTMAPYSKNIKPGDVVTIKGICTGYLNDVVIIKSLLLN